MYGKIFESMYDGSMYGQWEAIITMQQFVVLADKDGVVDVTPPALSARTSIPLEIIEKGIKVLESEDPYSRTDGDDGRRIKLLDEHRPWGWQIVNYGYYRDLASHEDKREKAKLRKRKQRKKERSQDSHATSRLSRHIDTDINIDINKEQQEYPFWLNQSHWSEYKKHRKEMKSPMTERAELLAIAKLKRLVDAGHSQERVVEQSIEMGWKGLFDVKDGVADSKYTKPPECGSCGQVSSSIKKGLKCPYCEKVV